MTELREILPAMRLFGAISLATLAVVVGLILFTADRTDPVNPETRNVLGVLMLVLLVLAGGVLAGGL